MVDPVHTHKHVIKSYSAFSRDIFLFPDLIMKASRPFTFMSKKKKYFLPFEFDRGLFCSNLINLRVIHLEQLMLGSTQKMLISHFKKTISWCDIASMLEHPVLLLYYLRGLVSKTLESFFLDMEIRENT